MPRSHIPHLADPSTIEPYTEAGTLQVVIETPKNSRLKYAFDHERRIIVLKKILPAGMAFPYDFGFVPSTLAPDGDPIDVLVLMDEPAFPGVVLDTRIIGVIRGEDQLPSGEKQRNDRLLGVAEASHTFADVHTLDDLPKNLLDHMGEFFVQYPQLLGGKVYNLLGPAGPEEANRLIEEARQQHSN